MVERVGDCCAVPVSSEIPNNPRTKRNQNEHSDSSLQSQAPKVGLCRRFINWVLNFFCCRKKVAQSQPVANVDVIEPEKSKLQKLFEKATHTKTDQAEVGQLLVEIFSCIQSGDQLDGRVVRGIAIRSVEKEWRPLFDAILARKEPEFLNEALDAATDRLCVHCEDQYITPIQKLIDAGADPKTMTKTRMQYFEWRAWEMACKEARQVDDCTRGHAGFAEVQPILQKMAQLIQSSNVIDFSNTTRAIVRWYPTDEGKQILEGFLAKKPSKELLNKALLKAISYIRLTENKAYVGAAEKLIAAGADGDGVKWVDGKSANEVIAESKKPVSSEQRERMEQVFFGAKKKPDKAAAPPVEIQQSWEDLCQTVWKTEQFTRGHSGDTEVIPILQKMIPVLQSKEPIDFSKTVKTLVYWVRIPDGREIFKEFMSRKLTDTQLLNKALLETISCYTLFESKSYIEAAEQLIDAGADRNLKVGNGKLVHEVIEKSKKSGGPEQMERMKRDKAAAPPSEPPTKMVPPSVPIEEINTKLIQAGRKWYNSTAIHKDPKMGQDALKSMVEAIQAGADIDDPEVIQTIVDSYNWQETVVTAALNRNPSKNWLNRALDRSIWSLQQSKEGHWHELAKKLIAAGADVSTLNLLGQLSLESWKPT